jgi:hypothetical protein
MVIVYISYLNILLNTGNVFFDGDLIVNPLHDGVQLKGRPLTIV